MDYGKIINQLRDTSHTDASLEAADAIESLLTSGTHTCHEWCRRPLCQLQRENAILVDKISQLETNISMEYEDYDSLSDEYDILIGKSERLEEALQMLLDSVSLNQVTVGDCLEAAAILREFKCAK
jgi:hypothetical protein